MNILKFTIKTVYVILVIFIPITLISCSRHEQEVKETFFAFDTIMSISVIGKNAKPAMKEAKTEIENLEKTLSVTIATSDIGKLNKTGSCKLSPDSAYIMDKALEINNMTDNAFSPAIYPIMRIWGFPDKNYRVPGDTEIKEALTLIDISNIKYDKDNRLLTLTKKGMMMDFGGIAKGYAADKLVEIFHNNDVNNGLLNLGGNVYAMGLRKDNLPWNIAIEDPEKEGYMVVLSLSDTSLVTSGGYERYFEENGKSYHHIMDPNTGKPANNDLTSVSIVCKSSTMADGLSTAVYVMGLERAIKLWRENPDFDMVLLTDNKELYITDGIKDKFSNAQYPVTIID